MHSHIFHTLEEPVTYIFDYGPLDTFIGSMSIDIDALDVTAVDAFRHFTNANIHPRDLIKDFPSNDLEDWLDCYIDMWCEAEIEQSIATPGATVVISIRGTIHHDQLNRYQNLLLMHILR